MLVRQSLLSCANTCAQHGRVRHLADQNLQCRLNASHRAAERYIQQFPSPMLSHVATFVSYMAGSFAALLLFLAMVDDMLLERHLYGRNLVWSVLSASHCSLLSPD